MADIAIFRINYKSDFILTLQSDAGWLTPFCIKFWTGAPSQAYFAGFDGTTYTHCAPVEGEPTKLVVQFDNHHLPVGDLKYQIGYHFTVADFPTSVEDEVINQATVIINNDGEEQQVMLGFNGETAPEIEFSLPAYANEAQRIANEEQRIVNEEQRINNEQQRIRNEEARIAAEEIRQQNEQQRIRNEETRIEEFARLKSAAIAATDAATDAASLANEKAQLAADKAGLAQAAATLANEKAQLAADKAALAQAAATLANGKAQLAEDKADLAQQKADYAQEQGNYAKEQGDYAKEQAEAAGELQQKLEAGEVVPLLAGNLQPFVDRGPQPFSDEWSGVVRTAGGDESLDSVSGMELLKLSVAEEGLFKATAYKTTGKNLLHDAVAIGTGYYVLCPKLTLGTFGTADENNGVLFNNSAEESLRPTVYFKAIGNGVPTSISDGEQLTPTTVEYNGKTYYVYQTSGVGYLIVSGITYADTCMKLGWSRGYDDFVAPTDEADAGSAIALTASINAVHSYGYLVAVHTPYGLVSDSLERISDTQVRGNRNNDRVSPSWTHTLNEDGTYTHSVTIASMAPDSGAFLLQNGVKTHLNIEGQVASFTDSNATVAAGGYVYFVLATSATVTSNLTTHAKLDDWGIEGFGSVEGTAIVEARYYRGILDTLAGIATSRMANAEEEIENIKEQMALTGDDFMAAAWKDSQSSPAAIEKAGNDEAIDYVPVLIDHTRNDVSGSAPVGNLKHNNYLRFADGSFASVVVITQEMYNECMANDLYIDGTKYCDAGAFNASAFYAAYMRVQTVNGVKKIAPTVALKKGSADGEEVSHYLMPWETASVDYSVMMAHRHKIYFLQNAQGKSGKVWNALSLTPKVFDGLVMTEQKATAFSLTTPTNTMKDGTRRMRSHFAAFNGSAAAADGYTAGRAGYVSELFVNTGRKMGACALAWNNASNGYVVHARADNADPTEGMPFAEGGWHSFNAFVAWLEVKYGTRDLIGIFKSGISANDACSNEAQWLVNGGVRCKVAGSTDAWEYRTLGASSAICFRNNNGVHAATNWSDMLNLSAPKEACMEAQIAASYAVEMGVQAGEEFECYGYTYTWAALPGTVSLADGRMNCVLMSKRTGIANGLNAQDVATSFDVEVMLRMSLFEGASLSGDVYNQRNGGLEAVGTHIRPNSGGQTGELIEVYSEPDQARWIKNDSTAPGVGTRFPCESAYQKINEHLSTASGYSIKDYAGTPFKVVAGAGLRTFMCHYGYDNNYWAYSTYGQRARIGLRFRGNVNYGFCSPRILYAAYAVASANFYYCGSAQVRLAESATPAQPE